ncbi:unnamed protein product [Adineta steineri]|uniref:NAD(P)(+)--arginine ADP-ribosyltransferase n=1 Tax=Adineta steineri TaxID=433720 RepID=A0A819ETC2_9BILA|nr:unnamed protein product [Adineta steineri]CAF3856286.1 unnamed protein product [Adineta steineri]
MSHSGDRFTDDELENKRLPACFSYVTWQLLSLEDAMKELQDVLIETNRFVEEAKKHCLYPNEHNLTKDESAAIYMYTMEMSHAPCIYRILNESLRLEDRTKMLPWFGYLKLLDSATSKLPNFIGIVWRGIAEDVTMRFKTGGKITWWSINSCSTSIDVISSLLTEPSSSTLLCIKCLNGKSISSYRCNPIEDEVILMPGAKFIVVADTLSFNDGLNIIHLEEINDDDDDYKESKEEESL